MAGREPKATALPGSGTVAAAVLDEPGARTGMDVFHAQATWGYPAKVHGSGPVEVASDAAAGTQVAIWVDDNGRPASGPRPDTEMAGTAVLAGTAAMTALSSIALAGYALGRRTIDRKAAAAWDAEWEGAEPEWSGRPRRRPEVGDP